MRPKIISSTSSLLCMTFILPFVRFRIQTCNVHSERLLVCVGLCTYLKLFLEAAISVPTLLMRRTPALLKKDNLCRSSPPVRRRAFSDRFLFCTACRYHK